MTFTRHLRILSLIAVALALATPALALNPQPLPLGMRFNPAAVSHAQGTGAWNRGAFVLRCEVRVRCQHADVCAPSLSEESASRNGEGTIDG